MRMETEIRKQLHIIERDRHVKILYAAEAGSRVWGFESKDSDYDVRFIYVRPISSYISLAARRDVIEPKDLPNLDPLLDMSGWDVLKALELASNSNPGLLEWLRSPKVYHKLQPFYGDLMEIMQQWSRRQLCYHYASMAFTQMKKHLNNTGEPIHYKKYFYALYPLMAVMWVKSNLTRTITDPRKEIASLPPLNFMDLMKEVTFGNSEVQDIYNVVEELMRSKRSGNEKDPQPRLKEVDDFISNNVERFRKYAKNVPELVAPNMMRLEDLAQRTIKMYQG